jgi:hypothetical protein
MRYKTLLRKEQRRLLRHNISIKPENFKQAMKGCEFQGYVPLTKPIKINEKEHEIIYGEMYVYYHGDHGSKDNRCYIFLDYSYKLYDCEVGKWRKLIKALTIYMTAEITALNDPQEPTTLLHGIPGVITNRKNLNA